MKKKDLENICALAQTIADLTRKMEELGLFTHHRELVSCSQCELTEDVTFDGYLLVYRGNNPGDITEMRFVEKPDGAVVCPDCGEIVSVLTDEKG